MGVSSRGKKGMGEMCLDRICSQNGRIWLIYGHLKTKTIKKESNFEKKKKKKKRRRKGRKRREREKKKRKKKKEEKKK